MPHTFTQTSEQKSHTAAFGGLLFVFTGVAKNGTDLRFPRSRLLTLHKQFIVNTVSHSLRSLSIGPIVVWASGNPFQKESELLFMSSTLKRVLYSPSQIRAKGKGEHEDELLKQRKKKQV